MIVIYGAYGGHNIGDEFILHTLLSEITNSSTIRTSDITIISNKNNENYRPQGVRTLNKNSLFSIVRSLKKSNLLIGGGQLLNGSKTNKGLYYIILILLIARAFGRKTLLLGVGAENIKSAQSKLLFRAITRLSDNCVFRDEYSRNMVKLNSQNIEKTIDLVFINNYLKRHKICSKKIRIGLAIHADPYWKLSSKLTTTNIINTLLKELNEDIEIKVLAHDNRANFDKGLLLEIEEHYQGKEQRVSFSCLESIESTSNTYKNLDFIVSARMHPLIIGSIFGARPIPIGQSGKVISLFSDSGLLLKDQDNIGPAVAQRVLTWTSADDENLEAWLEKNKSKSNRNIAIIKDFLC